MAPADLGRRYSESRDVLGELTEDRTAALTALVRSRGVTLSAVVQMAWAIVLGELTSPDDVTFGTTVSGRPPAVEGIESMIGLFVNTLPVRVRLDAAESLGQLLDRIQAEQAALTRPPLRESGRRPAGGREGAVFDTMSVFESYPVDRAGLTAESDVAGIRVVDVSAPTPRTIRSAWLRTSTRDCTCESATCPNCSTTTRWPRRSSGSCV